MDDSTVTGHDARAAETFAAGFAAGRAAALAEVDAAVILAADPASPDNVGIWYCGDLGWQLYCVPDHDELDPVPFWGETRPTPTAAILSAAAALTRQGGAP